MNLLEQLKLEIEEKDILNDKFAIARYIYIRTGELFDYYALYILFPWDIKEDFNNEVKDIRNIRDFNIVCFSWARLYADLLKCFDIDARVVFLKGHAKVILTVDGYEIYADLTKGFNDIFRIKFGFDTCNYNIFASDRTKLLFTEKVLEVDKKINYYQGISGLDVLGMLEWEINSDAKTHEEQVRMIFNVCQSYFNFHKPSNVAANAFIIYVLNYLSDYTFNYQGKHTFYYDMNNNKRIDVYIWGDVIYLYDPSLEKPFYEVSLDYALALKKEMSIVWEKELDDLERKRMNGKNN